MAGSLFNREIEHAIPDLTLLPVTGFNTEDEANSLWERVALNLINDGIGPSNARTDVDGLFEELALNAAQHSRSTLPCRATLECFVSDDEIVYVIGVNDAGVGIPASLRNNPEYEGILDDTEAIARAAEQDVSGTTQQRGAGLYHVTERVQAYRGELAIISGDGFLMVRDGGEPILGSLQSLDSSPYGGTIALVSLPIPSA